MINFAVRPAQDHTASEGQLVAVLSAVRAWTLGVTQATIVQVLCVPVQEEEGEGLAPRGTWPLEEAACSLGANWSQGEEEKNLTPQDTWSCHSQGIW